MREGVCEILRSKSALRVRSLAQTTGRVSFLRRLGRVEKIAASETVVGEAVSSWWGHRPCRPRIRSLSPALFPALSAVGVGNPALGCVVTVRPWAGCPGVVWAATGSSTLLGLLLCESQGQGLLK